MSRSVKSFREKVTAELPSTVSGKLHEIYTAEGETVAIGTVICTIETSEQVLDVGRTSGDSPTNDRSASSATNTVQAGESVDVSMRSRISPVVRRLADEHQIDLANVRGTGIGGRITRKDVLAAIDSPNVPVRSTGLHLTQPEKPQVPEGLVTDTHGLGNDTRCQSRPFDDRLSHATKRNRNTACLDDDRSRCHEPGHAAE